jgi:hypothetical protein
MNENKYSIMNFSNLGVAMALFGPNEALPLEITTLENNN